MAGACVARIGIMNDHHWLSGFHLPSASVAYERSSDPVKANDRPKNSRSLLRFRDFVGLSVLGCWTSCVAFDALRHACLRGDIDRAAIAAKERISTKPLTGRCSCPREKFSNGKMTVPKTASNDGTATVFLLTKDVGLCKARPKPMSPSIQNIWTEATFVEASPGSRAAGSRQTRSGQTCAISAETVQAMHTR